MNFLRNTQEKLDRLWTQKVTPYVAKVQKNAIVAKIATNLEKHMPTISRIMIVTYFLNLAVTHWSYYFKYNVPGFPWFSFPMFVCAAAVAINWKVHIFGCILVGLAFKDAAHIIYNQIAVWLVHNHPLYINELMVKKFSMMGAMAMLVVNDPYFKTTLDNTSKALQGLVVKDEPKYKITQRLSVVLLIVRLLISTLFLYVGYGEVKRQLEWSHGVMHHGHVHKRPAGDGHNNMWPKLFEFALTLPFVIGYKTKWAALAIATCLVLEAVIYWNFLSPSALLLGIGYSIHSRDHFSVNIGVAGGLLLLSRFGGGRYSADELLKKND